MYLYTKGIRRVLSIFQEKICGMRAIFRVLSPGSPISLSIMGQLFIAFHYPVTAPVNTKAKEINNCKQLQYL